MKKSNQAHMASHGFGLDQHEHGHSHFRLCHHCLHLNEAPIAISRCEKCDGMLSAVIAHFDASEHHHSDFDGLDEEVEFTHHSSSELDAEHEEGDDEVEDHIIATMLPINGLSVVW